RNDQTLSSSVRVEVLTRLSTIVESQGNLERAGNLLTWNVEEAARTLGADDPLTLEAERSLANNLLLRGRYSESREHVDKLLARAARARADIYIPVLSLSAALATYERNLSRAKKEGTEARDRARTLGDPDIQRQVLEDYGDMLLQIGDGAGGV